ncbi:putative DNA replication complex GINS protein [Talaromyces proteolyticus]|uniref:DNA replication complex GINS protein PSF2 n=1 Tax=Talaromyces proteolyticus TaxID=1131652 RepID=A0AAD4PVZ5_9EURO|nr:putative DNA replication complex GINS protein [Talaromyces proteolyticus]KAH8691342.1 putative DNA replication complex GINS protein [Talaromyces proteolyticus]
MAFPLPRGISPSEIEFISEMEMVTVVPRQRLEGLDLLSGPTEKLLPPQRATLPLWLAILLKRQRRVNIVPPYWLHPESLQIILQFETETREYTDAFSPPPRLPGQRRPGDDNRRNQPPPPRPKHTLDGERYHPSPPFLPQNTALTAGEESERDKEIALPYHWLEVGNMLLDAASDDLTEPDQIRRLLKDLREVRMSKMRKGVDILDTAATAGGGVALTGVGAMEIGEMRGFVAGVVEGLRKIGASREQARREQLAEEGPTQADAQDEDDDMEF